jgi:AcrR family transcriptional regulator
MANAAIAGANPARDGRTRRAERSRRAIVQALLELVGEGTLEPTAQAVADRAGVTIRTVFRHFNDTEGLFAEMGARMDRELRPLLEQDAPREGLEERVRALVQSRVALFERIAPYKRSANQQRRRSPLLRARHAALVRDLRADLLRRFPELERAPEALVEALDLAASFEAWDRLRSEQRLGRERAQAALERLVQPLARELAAGAR